MEFNLRVRDLRVMRLRHPLLDILIDSKVWMETGRLASTADEAEPQLILPLIYDPSPRGLHVGTNS